MTPHVFGRLVTRGVGFLFGKEGGGVNTSKDSRATCTSVRRRTEGGATIPLLPPATLAKAYVKVKSLKPMKLIYHSPAH